MKILAINPGSTSTRVALYDGLSEVFTDLVEHSAQDLAKYEAISEQFEMRSTEVVKTLKTHKVELGDIDAFVGRGGLLFPIPSGTYAINDLMLQHLKAGVQGEHASNLGGLIAFTLAEPQGKPSYIVDPVVVDELGEEARYTGIKGVKRVSIFHALNQKGTAKKYAKSQGKDYQDMTLIVAHMGGGVSVGLHHKGKVIDVNNALGGDGPFSVERTGSIALFEFLKFAEGKPPGELKKAIKGQGGLVSYFQTNDVRDVLKLKNEGSKEADLVLRAMIRSIAAEIAARASVVGGRVDQIILTGGVAHSDYITQGIRERVEFIAPLSLYPGEHEMESLVAGVLRTTKEEEPTMTYAPQA